ncbi:hypothetical protein AMTR_s00131p00027940, partial [Amborella trichopoda]
KRAKKEASESAEPSDTSKSEVHRKSARLSKRTSSDQDVSPSVQSAPGKAHDLPPRPKKRAKSKAFPCPTPLSRVMPPIKEPVIPTPEVVIAQPAPSDKTSFSLSYRSKSIPAPMVEIVCMVMEAPSDGGPTDDVSTEPEAMQLSTLSPPGQADFPFTIAEEACSLDDDTGAINVIPDTEVTAPKVPTSTISEAEPRSEPDAPSSETLALVPHESAIIVEVPPLAVASSSLRSSVLSTLSNKKASLALLIAYQDSFKDEDMACLAELKAIEEEIARLQACHSEGQVVSAASRSPKQILRVGKTVL